uniref:Ig-like domain-containing protein n=1 Tax=Glossina brevipalpis TaxID=37001 RepID=A0A1A9WUX8_9MUSC
MRNSRRYSNLTNKPIKRVNEAMTRNPASSSLLVLNCPNRDHDHDSHGFQDDELFSRRRMRAPQSKQKWRTYQSQESAYHEQSKYDYQYQYSYHQQYPSNNPHYYEQKRQQQESYRQYHYQQPESKGMPGQQKYLYTYQTSSSPYTHSIYRGRNSATVDRIDPRHLRAIDSYNTNKRSVSNENSRRMIPFGHAVPDNSFADSSDHNEQIGEENEGEEDEKGEALYAIKWYKENEEFYRYVPKAKPPKTSYKVEGVRVIEEHSDSSRVLLRGLTINSTGLYRCEISAEAPNFSSVEAEGHMDVLYLPRDGPFIRGQQLQYKIGEILDLNCTSGKSHPASHLQWHINDEMVSKCTKEKKKKKTKQNKERKKKTILSRVISLF